MVKSCSAYNCTLRYTKGLKFHLFPKDTNLRDQWIAAVGRKNFQPSNSAVICSNHFKRRDYNHVHGNIVLKKSAIPSIFNFPNSTPTGQLAENVIDEVIPQTPKQNSRPTVQLAENLIDEVILQTPKQNSTPTGQLAENPIDEVIPQTPKQEISVGIDTTPPRCIDKKNTR